jgi:hypothetical protein
MDRGSSPVSKTRCLAADEHGGVHGRVRGLGEAAPRPRGRSRAPGMNAYHLQMIIPIAVES